MKPKIVCSKCGGELQKSNKFCTSCGSPIEWRDEVLSEASDRPMGMQGSERRGASQACRMCGSINAADAAVCDQCGAPLGGAEAHRRADTKEPTRQRHSKKRAEEREQAHLSWKAIFGFVSFLIVGIVLLELTTNQRHVPQPVAPSQAPAGARLEALSQIEDAEKRVRENPNDPSLLLHLAHLLQDNRFYDKAIATYNRYLDVDPKNADARVDLGICYHDEGNFEEAIRQIERALKDQPKHLLAHFNLGIVYLSAGRIEEANAWFRKTVALSPNSEIGQKAQRILAQYSNIPSPTTN